MRSSNFPSDSATGLIRFSMATLRFSISPLASSVWVASEDFASWRNCSEEERRASAESALKVSESLISARSSRACFSAAALSSAVEAGAEFGELVAERLGVLLVALGLGGGLGEAGFDFRRAAFLGFHALGGGGDFSGRGEPGEQPAEEKPDEWR